MAGAYELFKTDPELETKGVTHDFGDFWIRLARSGGANKRYARVLTRATKKYRRAIDTETLDPDKADEIMIEVFAETIVLDWGGVKDEEGNVLEFTFENVVKVFTDLPDLFADVREQANKAALYRAEEREEASGN